MALIGIIAASLINIFMKSDSLSYIIITLGYLIQTFIATFFIRAVNVFLKPLDEWLTKKEKDGN